jgi:hypothetical protein
MIIYELLFLYACFIDYIDFLYTTKMSSRTLRFSMTMGSVNENFEFTMTIVKQNVIKRPKKQFKNLFFHDNSKMSSQMSSI